MTIQGYVQTSNVQHSTPNVEGSTARPAVAPHQFFRAFFPERARDLFFLSRFELGKMLE
jgi:hypothetical protein